MNLANNKRPEYVSAEAGRIAYLLQSKGGHFTSPERILKSWPLKF
jgi:hypothetical protein